MEEGIPESGASDSSLSAPVAPIGGQPEGPPGGPEGARPRHAGRSLSEGFFTPWSSSSLAAHTRHAPAVVLRQGRGPSHVLPGRPSAPRGGGVPEGGRARDPHAFPPGRGHTPGGRAQRGAPSGPDSLRRSAAERLTRTRGCVGGNQTSGPDGALMVELLMERTGLIPGGQLSSVIPLSKSSRNKFVGPYRSVTNCVEASNSVASARFSIYKFHLIHHCSQYSPPKYMFPSYHRAV